MSNEATREWVLPASIPFEELKRKDLEECVYWLFDAMGAKDLEWRTGGSGGGAADGGRDLEAHFYTPGADSEIETQTWWIECKGRSGTVGADEVKSAVLNAQANGDLDYVVIATNTQFSNPTRDWVKEWQRSRPRPKVKLWDHSHLEKLFSRHPDVVLRLFSEALSLQGRFQAMESRFWNKLEFVPPKSLADLWEARQELELTSMGIFAAIANELAHGSITNRPWGAKLTGESLLQVLQISIRNITYLVARCNKGGVEQKPISRTISYLILCALDTHPAAAVSQLMTDALCGGSADTMPQKLQEYLLGPIADQLLSEIQEVCSADCPRMSLLGYKALTINKGEVEDYWLRLEPEDVDEPEDGSIIRIEKLDGPCKVGFSVDADNHCPLFAFDPKPTNIFDFFAMVQRVIIFRKAEAKQQREEQARKRSTTSPLHQGGSRAKSTS